MTREQIWVATLQKAIRANFCIKYGKSLSASPEFEESKDFAVFMYYGLITEKFGEDYAKSLAFLSGEYEYDDIIKGYRKMLSFKEENPKGGKKKWARYENKRQLVLNYFKHGKK